MNIKKMLLFVAAIVVAGIMVFIFIKQRQRSEEEKLLTSFMLLITRYFGIEKETAAAGLFALADKTMMRMLNALLLFTEV